MKRLRSFWKDTKGTTAVEFGMVATLMLAMLFGIIELGRIFWTQNAVQSAIELTARYYIVHTSTSDTDLQTYARAAMTSMQLDGSALTVTVTKTTSQSIKFIQLDGNYAYSPLGTSVKNFANLQLKARSRISYP
ncbi:MAG: pilus assembly protein [Alphaproteobacteria bacterium]|nr:MAG: pilus assembly protein [Alphaproteobacteria bacterium]